MSRLLVDDVTKTDARALLNVNKMATISDIVAPRNEYIYASGANELTVVEGCVIAVGGAGIFKTANTILTAANLDAGSAFAVGKDYYVYICDSRIDSADEKQCYFWHRLGKCSKQRHCTTFCMDTGTPPEMQPRGYGIFRRRHMGRYLP